MTKTEITYGIIFSLATLLWITGEYLLGLHSLYIDMHPVSSLIFLFVAVFIIYKGMKTRKKEYDGRFGFFQAFLSGFYIVVVSVLLSPLVNYIFHTFINPEFFATMINQVVSTMKMTEDKAVEYFSLTSYIRQGIVGGLISGTIISLVLAAFIRVKK